MKGEGVDGAEDGLAAALGLISGLVFAIVFLLDTGKNKIYCLMPQPKQPKGKNISFF
jgi:hypothetical protein